MTDKKGGKSMRQAKKFMKRTAMLLIMVTVLLSSGMATGMFTGDLITAEAAAMRLSMKSAELVPNESLSLTPLYNFFEE